MLSTKDNATASMAPLAGVAQSLTAIAIPDDARRPCPPHDIAAELATRAGLAAGHRARGPLARPLTGIHSCN